MSKISLKLFTSIVPFTGTRTRNSKYFVTLKMHLSRQDLALINFKSNPFFKFIFSPYESVHTKFFLPDDVVDVDITIDGYLEDTSVKNLSLSGFHYDYTILPHPNIQDIKGLMFIELVLFDTEKFIHNHTNRVKTLDDDD